MQFALTSPGGASNETLITSDLSLSPAKATKNAGSARKTQSDDASQLSSSELDADNPPVRTYGLAKRTAAPRFNAAETRPVKRAKPASKPKAEPATTTLAVKPAKEELLALPIDKHARSVSPAGSIGSSVGEEGTKTKKKPPKPMKLAPAPKLQLVENVTSNDQFLLYLYIRDFATRFAPILYKRKQKPTKSKTRSGKTRKTSTSRQAPPPRWLVACSNHVMTFWQDTSLSLGLLDGLVRLIEREVSGDVYGVDPDKDEPFTEKDQSEWLDYFFNQVDQFVQLRQHLNAAIKNPSLSAKCWKAAERLLTSEGFLKLADTDVFETTSKESNPDESIEPLSTESSDLSDVDSNPRDGSEVEDTSDDEHSVDLVSARPTPRKGQGYHDCPVPRKLAVIEALIDLVLQKSESVRNFMSELTEKEKDARATFYKLRRDVHDTLATLRAKKPNPATTRALADWQSKMDDETASFKANVADLYGDLHFSEVRFEPLWAFGRRYYLPAPCVGDTSYPDEEDEEVMTSSWSVLYHGAPMTPSTTECCDKFYRFSGVEEIRALAAWIEGLCKVHAYERKLADYEREARGEEPLPEATDVLLEEKQAHATVETLKAFAEYIEVRMQ